MSRKLSLLAILPFALTACVARAQTETQARRLPAPAVDGGRAGAPVGLRTAVFSGGCFWGVQGVFSHVRGVAHAVSGYAGGQASTANYETVSTGGTGHAESVQVTYDPRVVSYGELMRVFFSVTLDPTQVNRQGPDEGSQYRSVLWVADAVHRKMAEGYIRQLNGGHAFPAAIATQVQSLHGFYPAEHEHQDFMALHPSYPYIRAYDIDKVVALRSLYPTLYALKPVLGG